MMPLLQNKAISRTCRQFVSSWREKVRPVLKMAI